MDDINSMGKKFTALRMTFGPNSTSKLNNGHQNSTTKNSNKENRNEGSTKRFMPLRNDQLFPGQQTSNKKEKGHQNSTTKSSNKDNSNEDSTKKFMALRYDQLYPGQQTSNKKEKDASMKKTETFKALRNEQLDGLLKDGSNSSNKRTILGSKKEINSPMVRQNIVRSAKLSKEAAKHIKKFTPISSQTKNLKRKANCDSSATSRKRAKQHDSGGVTVNCTRRSSIYLKGSLKKAKKQLFTNKVERSEKNLFELCDMNLPGIGVLNQNDSLSMENGNDYEFMQNEPGTPKWDTSIDSTGSGREFLSLEAECGIFTKSPNMDISPLSSITNKLQATAITQRYDTSKTDQSKEITKILEKLNKSAKVYQANHTSAINKINKQLHNLTENYSSFMSDFNDAMKHLNVIKGDKKSDSFKPSTPRRTTPRPKTPLHKNLRIATLHKNLKLSGITELPKKDEVMEKAINYYNSTFRKNYESLATPKADRAMLEESNSVSINVQKQCLLLMDNTPKANK